MQDIPSIDFESEDEEINGIDVIPLSKIEKLAEQDTPVDPTKPHQHRFYMLVYYTEGKSQHLVDFDWHPVEKNTLVYLSKDQINAYQFTPGLKGICLLFTQEYFERYMGHLSQELVLSLFTSKLFDPVIKINRASDLEKYFHLLNTEFNTKWSTEKEMVLSSLFTIIMSKAHEFRKDKMFLNRDASKVRLVSKFIDLVKSNYTENRNAGFYATELGITYKHLNVCCKEVLELTAKQYIDDYVVLEAKRRLINSEVKSTELAYQLGFDEPTNFTKFFKSNSGLTPNAFKMEYF